MTVLVFHDRFIDRGPKFVLRLFFHKEEIKVRHRVHTTRLRSISRLSCAYTGHHQGPRRLVPVPKEDPPTRGANSPLRIYISPRSGVETLSSACPGSLQVLSCYNCAPNPAGPVTYRPEKDGDQTYGYRRRSDSATSALCTRVCLAGHSANFLELFYFQHVPEQPAFVSHIPKARRCTYFHHIVGCQWKADHFAHGAS